MGFPLYVTCCLSVGAFTLLCLCLVFVSLIRMCLGLFLLGFILYGTLCPLDLIDYFVFLVGKIFTYTLFQTFVILFLFLSFFWDPYNSNVGELDTVSEVSETVLNCFHSFLHYSARQELFLPFYLPAHGFVLLQIFCS